MFIVRDLWFVVFTAVKIQVQVFWVVMLGSVATNDSEDPAASIFRMKYPTVTLHGSTI
jgi:hypothetical protein